MELKGQRLTWRNLTVQRLLCLLLGPLFFNPSHLSSPTPTHTTCLPEDAPISNSSGRHPHPGGSLRSPRDWIILPIPPRKPHRSLWLIHRWPFP